jgi:hypothetical protein
MHEKLDLLEGQHSAEVELLDGKPMTHSTEAAVRMDELLLLQVKHGISRLLRLKAGTLHQELRTLVLELRT